VTLSDSLLSVLLPTATATVKSRFDPVAVTVCVQLNVEPVDIDTPLALGPTASTVTPPEVEAAVTVKVTVLLATPATVTTTGPLVAPLGTGTVMLVALQVVGVASVPLNVTALVPAVVPKFVPAIVTTVPIGPDVGLSVVMLGAGDVTVNATPLLA
jgi:hypothetical protein